MKRTGPVAALLGVLVFTLGLPATAGANCGAEGCPLAPNGPEARMGRFAFTAGYQAIDQDQLWDGGNAVTSEQALKSEGGLGHVLEEETRTRATLFNASVRLTRALDLALSMPWIDRIHRHALAHHAGFFIESAWHMQGLGDATALANWRVTGSEFAGFGALTLQLGAKLPTGDTDVAPVDGEVPEASARPGSGSTDVLAGVSYRRLVAMRTPRGNPARVPLTASASARYNGRGTDDYRMGNEWDASVGGGYPLGRTVQLLAQLNASAHGRDVPGTTDAVAHSTGNYALYASPGLAAQLVPGVSAYGYYQLRLFEHSNGPQLVSPYHLSFGLAYSLR